MATRPILRPAFFLGSCGLGGCLLTLMMPGYLLFLAPCLLFAGWLTTFFWPKSVRFSGFAGMMAACLFSMGLIASVWGSLSLTAQMAKDTPLSLTGIAVSKERITGGNVRYLVNAQTLDGQDCPQGMQLLVSTSAPMELFTEFDGTVSLFEPEDNLMAQLQTGVLASGWLSGKAEGAAKSTDTGERNNEPVYGKAVSGFWVQRWGQAMRTKAEATYLTLLGDSGNLLYAAVTGDTSRLTADQNEIFSRCGISHLFAVSGLHLSIVTAALLQFLGMLRLSRRAGIFLTLPVLWGMVLLAGSSPSALRAGLMLSLTLIGGLFAKKADGLNLVGVATVILLCAQPTLAADRGFLLSVAATTGILCGAKPLQVRLFRLWNHMRTRHNTGGQLAGRTVHASQTTRWAQAILGLFATSLAAFFATLPVMFLVFDRYSLAAPATNLLMIPFAGPLVGGGLLLFLGSLAGIPLAVLRYPAVPLRLWADGMNTLAGFLAKLPICTFYPVTPLLVFFTALLGGCLLIRLRKRYTTHTLTAFYLIFALALTGCTTLTHQTRQNKTMALMLTDRTGHTILIQTQGTAMVISDGMTPATAIACNRQLIRWGTDSPALICLAKTNRTTLRAVSSLWDQDGTNILIAPQMPESHQETNAGNSTTSSYDHLGDLTFEKDRLTVQILHKGSRTVVFIRQARHEQTVCLAAAVLDANGTHIKADDLSCQADPQMVFCPADTVLPDRWASAHKATWHKQLLFWDGEQMPDGAALLEQPVFSQTTWRSSTFLSQFF